MVCLVHDRRYISKFHAAVNKLRQTKQFTTITLRELPKKCCSCTEKVIDSTSTKIRPLITSLDFDEMQMICLKFDLERCLRAKITLSTSQIRDYIILSFPTLPDSVNRTNLAYKFIVDQEHELYSSEKTHQVQFDFLTSGSSIELRSIVLQWQYDLVTQSSNYIDAQQAVSGLWVIISGDSQTQIDARKDVLQNKWKQFLSNINMQTDCTRYIGPKGLYPLITVSESINTRRCNTTQDIRLNIRQIKAMQQQLAAFEISDSKPDDPLDDDETYHGSGDLVENVAALPNTRLQYLFGRYENSNKSKRPRTHRRQHILALAMVA